jgi:hypothetical protein
MTDERRVTDTSPTGSTTSAPSLVTTVLHVAWLAILLGLAMEGLLLLLAAGFGIFPSLKEIVADLVRQSSWSLVVCVGLSLGTAASKLRAQLMGLLGLLAAPVAFSAARSLHEGTKKTLDIAGSASAVSFLILPLALLKGVEYGCLGLAIGWVGRRTWGVVAHMAVGLVVGLLFWGLILALTYWGSPSPPSTVELISLGLNEVLFPVGCSLVLFSAEALGKRATVET